MSTINGLYANAITPVAPRPQESNAQPQNQPHEQFSRTTFTSVEANQQNDASKGASGQRPEQDQTSKNQQDIEKERNQTNAKSSQDTEESKESQASKAQNDAKEEAKLKQDQEIISQLKSRDSEVRTHEMAHKIVGGKYAGAIQYDYAKGPDGNNYAVGGEVSISVSELNKPEMTAQKMQQVRQAALAPAEPSQQDRSVAAMATQIEMKAYADIAKMERIEEKAKAEAKEEYRKETSPSDNESKTAKNDDSADDESNSVDIGLDDFTVPSVDSTAITTSAEYSQSSGLNLNVIA